MSLADFEVSDKPLTSSIDEQDAAREAWFERRRGMFTCSRFGDLMSTGRKQDDPFSVAGWTYIYQVAAERLGSHKPSFSTAATRWGIEYEESALDAYFEQRKLPKSWQVRSGTTAFCRLERYAGGTPDALLLRVEPPESECHWVTCGALEVKCPYTPEEHLRYVVEGIVPPKYQWQVKGHLLVSGADWCDFVSFDPRMPDDAPQRLFVVRTNREEAQPEIDALRAKLLLAEQHVQRIIERTA